jgi:hypothetical protein
MLFLKENSCQEYHISLSYFFSLGKSAASTRKNTSILVARISVSPRRECRRLVLAEACAGFCGGERGGWRGAVRQYLRAWSAASAASHRSHRRLAGSARLARRRATVLRSRACCWCWVRPSRTGCWSEWMRENAGDLSRAAERVEEDESLRTGRRKTE